MKQAQITLFLIIGVLALFMAGLMLYYVGLNVKRPVQGNEDVTQITTYVNACIDQLSDEALLTAGQQSGIIFVSQGGVYPDFIYMYEDLFYNLGRKKKINEPAVANPARGRGRDTPSLEVHPENDEVVIPNSIISPGQGRAPAGASSEIPEYPTTYFPYKDASFRESEKSYLGYFGINILRKLNAEEDALSIQSQAESYVSTKLRSCTNFETTQAFPEYTIAEKGEVKTTVTFAETNTIVKVTYPLQITRKSTGKNTVVKDFLVEKKVRMKRIYEVANYIVNKDISDILFDIAESDEENAHQLWGMSIESAPIDLSENVGTFITIIDYESDINGQPYAFSFTRQNRNPALDFIKVSELRNLPSCSFDDANSVVNCRGVDQHGCCPTDERGCCCRHESFSPDPFTVGTGTFPLIAYDPDENKKTSIDDLRMTSNSFTITPPLPTNIPADHNPQTRTFKVRVYDDTLEDWQDVTFNIRWVYQC